MKSFYPTMCVFFTVLLNACATTLDPDVVPVSDFQADLYLGQWYEIARIDNRFEKGLSHVSANYSYREDGGIKVVNRGYDSKKKKWDVASGKAYFVGDESKGHLKVSFFGPIYGPYVVFDLGENYQYSFVTNHNKKYLWFLSRTPDVPLETKDRFINKINAMGFKTDKLVWVDQSKN